MLIIKQITLQSDAVQAQIHTITVDLLIFLIVTEDLFVVLAEAIVATMGMLVVALTPTTDQSVKSLANLAILLLSAIIGLI